MTTQAAGYVIFRTIVSSKIQFLLLQASYKDFHWSPPKGHVDPGEDAHTTALREVEEESGIKRSDINIIPEFENILEYKVNGKPKKVTYWLAELKNPDHPIQLSHEHQNYKWLDIQESLEILGHEQSKQLIQAAHDFLHTNKIV